MAKRQTIIPQYGTVMKRGVLYYRTRIKDANGKLVAIYAKTPEELYNKETLALEQIENATFHRKTPTVAEYCEWQKKFDLNIDLPCSYEKYCGECSAFVAEETLASLFIIYLF